MNIDQAKKIVARDPVTFLAAILELLEWKTIPPPIPERLLPQPPPPCKGYGDKPCPDGAPVFKTHNGPWPARCQNCRELQVQYYKDLAKVKKLQDRGIKVTLETLPRVEKPKLKVITGGARKGIDYRKTEYVGRAE